jgi:hypothetical protein
MSFDARCPYCRLKVKKVPDVRLGSNMQCVRCHNTFMIEPIEGTAAPSGGIAAKHSMTIASLVKEISPSAPAPAPGEGGTAPTLERRPANYPGLASFVLACFAVFAGTLLHSSMIIVLAGLLALLLGISGLLFPLPKQSRPILPAAGIAVSVPAMVVAAFLPRWAGLEPLISSAQVDDRYREAVIALSGKGAARRAAKGETNWADAREDALLHGDVRLRVRSAVVAPPQFEPVPGQTPPREPYLVIGLRITNAGISRQVPYSSWGWTPERPVLRDNHGKTIAEKSFPPDWIVKGRATKATIPPGKWLDDVLVFEPPSGSIDYLRLELPGAAVGTEGQLRMQIPKEMIRFR